MKRNGFKWSVNEILQLQRESELLELTVFEIAKIHKRSMKAILYKLAAEEFLVNPDRSLALGLKNKEKNCMKLRSSK